MRIAAFRALLLTGALLAVTACSKEPETAGAAPQVRRLTQEQYRNSIGDIFGGDVTIPGRFEPDPRSHGLQAVGASLATATPSGFEQYDLMARAIADQALATERRDRLPCRPDAVDKPDDACAATVLADYGRRLFRRPLKQEELAGRVALARDGAAASGDFYEGLKLSLGSLLGSPWFLFRHETAEADPGRPGQHRLDAFSLATRLSYFLWNTTPDAELLRAAEAGELDDAAGLARQVDRLIASPRYVGGLQAFFADMLGLSRMTDLAKDPIIYPAFNNVVSAEARAQTLMTISDHLVTRAGDYRDLFTTRHTFMTRNLGQIYQVPVAAESGWEPFEFGAGDGRAGLTSQVTFLALHSHPGRSSATLRGAALREQLLCQHVPDPPGNVDFTVVQDTANPVFKTARERLTAHSTDPACAGCHRVMDPIGLALETFDGLGRHRSTENDVPIDTSGDVDGRSFQNSEQLGAALRDLPQLVTCLVNRTWSYALGRPLAAGEDELIAYLEERLGSDGYQVPKLARQLALSRAFRTVAAPGGPAPAQHADLFPSPTEE